MKTSIKMVAMLLGIGIFPICTQAQKKVIIENEEPNSIMFVSRDKAGDEQPPTDAFSRSQHSPFPPCSSNW